MIAILSLISQGSSGLLMLVVTLVVVMMVVMVVLQLLFHSSFSTTLREMRAEMRSDFKEVFDDLRGLNRSMGHLEALDDRVTHLEQHLSGRVDRLEDKVNNSCACPPESPTSQN